MGRQVARYTTKSFFPDTPKGSQRLGGTRELGVQHKALSEAVPSV